jgi:hypothetical protein
MNYSLQLGTEKRPAQTTRSRPRPSLVVLISGFVFLQPLALAERASQDHGVERPDSFSGQNVATDFAPGTAVDSKARQAAPTEVQVPTAQSLPEAQALAQLSDNTATSGAREMEARLHSASKPSLLPSMISRTLPKKAATPSPSKPSRWPSLGFHKTANAPDSQLRELVNSLPHGGPANAGNDMMSQAERLAMLEKVTPENLKMAFNTKTKVKPPPTPPLEQDDGKPNPTWRELYAADEKHRDTHAYNYWRNTLKEVATDQGLTKNDEYTDFYSKVLSIHPGDLASVIHQAHEVVDKNHDANEKSYEYVDDLEKLANGTAAGYNRMAAAQFYAYDQVYGQLTEGHMAPGKSIEIVLPMGDHVRFKPNQGTLEDSTQTYFTSKFAEMVEAKLKPYHGMHFTFCIHTGTNLQASDIPRDFNTEADRDMETQPDGQKIRAGLKRLLTTRAHVLEVAVTKMMQNPIGDLKLARSDYHFPTPSKELMHFDKVMPAGIILVIAEDRLHRDDFQGTTMEEAEQHAKDVDKFDQTKCKIKDFDTMKTKTNLEEFAKPLEAMAPYMDLPEDLHDQSADTFPMMNALSASVGLTASRPTAPDVKKWAEANSKLPREQQLAHSDDIVKGYTEAQTEGDKYALVLKKREELGEGENWPLSGSIANALTSGAGSATGSSGQNLKPGSKRTNSADAVSDSVANGLFKIPG